MIGINVQGGTGAGRRRIKAHADWPCKCETIEPIFGVGILRGTANVPMSTSASPGELHTKRMQHGEVYSCPDCGARRP